MFELIEFIKKEIELKCKDVNKLKFMLSSLRNINA